MTDFRNTNVNTVQDLKRGSTLQTMWWYIPNSLWLSASPRRFTRGRSCGRKSEDLETRMDKNKRKWLDIKGNLAKRERERET